MASKYVKTCSISLAISEIQIKTTLKFLSQNEFYQKNNVTNTGEDVQEKEPFYALLVGM